MRARVWVRERAAALLLPVCTPRSFSPARLAPPPRERAHTTHCRRVSLALRISGECAVDVFAEITAAAPTDQQRLVPCCLLCLCGKIFCVLSFVFPHTSLHLSICLWVGFLSLRFLCPCFAVVKCVFPFLPDVYLPQDGLGHPWLVSSFPFT